MQFRSKVFLLLLVFLINPFDGISGVADKTYKICFNQDLLPYVKYDSLSNQWDGLILDWWELWASKVNVEAEFIPMKQEECVEQTMAGKTDAIAALFYSDEMAVKLDFSDPIIRMRTVFFLRKDIKIDSFSSLKDTIGLIDDGNIISFLKTEKPNLPVKSFQVFNDLRDLVQNQQIAGFVYHIPDIGAPYQKIQAPQGYYIFEDLYSQSLRAAVRSGNKEMLDLIVAGSSQISIEERLNIGNRSDLYKVDKTNVWILLGIIVVLVFVLIIILYRVNVNRRKLKSNDANSQNPSDWKKMIEAGENEKIEFKSSLRWDYRQEKPNKALEKVIAKTISAFLNTTGGILIIGVDDEGEILGLDNDYNCISKKNQDGFLLTITNVVNNHLGKSLHKFLQFEIITLNQKDVCIVKIQASDEPVFIGKQDNEEFFIRASASSQPLGVRETYNYIKSHWN